MKTEIYKLGEYKIIESDAGGLRWEAHFGLGALQEGRCFRKGALLFIGPAEGRRDGFLKLEFIDHLKVFPDWLKTKYFLRGLDIYHCQTGKRVTSSEMQLWMLDRGIDEGNSVYPERPGQGSSNISIARATKDVAFRLQQYEITRKANGLIIWKIPSGPNTVSGGTCIVLEDILFIGARQKTQSHLTRRQFVANLHQLPKWDQTKYYCPKLSLYDCKTGNTPQTDRRRRPSAKRAREEQGAGKRPRKTTRLKLTSPDLWEERTMLFSRWARKSVIYAADLLRLIISLFFTYLIRFCKELKRRWRLKRGKRSSVHHNDD